MSVGAYTEDEGRGEGADESSGTPSPHEGPQPTECGSREGQVGWDYVSSWLALPWCRVGYRPSCAVPTEGEGRVKPRAGKPACLPTLKNKGRLDCHDDDDDDNVGNDDDEELTPSLWGGGEGTA